MGATSHESELIATRIPKRVIREIESIAKREDETRSTVLRRLLRHGLEHERQRADAGASR